MERSEIERDLLVLAKVIGTNDFPLERPAVVGVDRESGALVRLTPFPWKGTDTDPPLPKWSWLHAATRSAAPDPRPESRAPDLEITATAYVDAKEGWRLRWPFVRPHIRRSVEEVQQLAREGTSTIGFVRPRPDADVMQLPMRLRFRCDAEDCASHHELPVLDWEMHETARAARERYGPEWATRFRQMWGPSLFERFDVHVLVSTYAQAVTKPYVAGLFAPPRQSEDPHEHVHHIDHRIHR